MQVSPILVTAVSLILVTVMLNLEQKKIVLILILM